MRSKAPAPLQFPSHPGSPLLRSFPRHPSLLDVGDLNKAPDKIFPGRCTMETAAQPGQGVAEGWGVHPCGMRFPFETHGPGARGSASPPEHGLS